MCPVAAGAGVLCADQDGRYACALERLAGCGERAPDGQRCGIDAVLVEDVLIVVHEIGDRHCPGRTPVFALIVDRVERVGIDGALACFDERGQVELVCLDEGGAHARPGIGLQAIWHCATGKSGLGRLPVSQPGETAVGNLDSRIGAVEALDDFVHRAQPGNGRHFGPHLKFGHHLVRRIPLHIGRIGRGTGNGSAGGEQADRCRPRCGFQEISSAEIFLFSPRC